MTNSLVALNNLAYYDKNTSEQEENKKPTAVYSHRIQLTSSEPSVCRTNTINWSA